MDDPTPQTDPVAQPGLSLGRDVNPQIQTQAIETHTNARSVLSIEDEQFISDLYSRALLKEGYLVTIERDGEKGLKEALTDRYDIILLDMLLPSMHGTEILQHLRGPDVTKPIHSKIIVITNFEERQEVRAEIEKLADAFLVKSDITPNQLVEFLNQIK